LWLLANQRADRLADLEVGGLVLLLLLRAGRLGAGVGVREIVLDRHVGSGLGVAAVVARVLGAADDLTFGIETLLGFADLIEVEVDCGFSADPAGAEAALEHLLDGAGEAEFGGVLEFFASLGGGGGAGGLAGAGEEVAAAVHHSDVLRTQAGNGGRDEIEDRLHALAVKSSDTCHCQDDAGLGFLPVAGERFAMRQDEVHSSGADALDGLDGAGEFAFHRAGLGDALLEAVGRQSVSPSERSKIS